MDRLCVIILSHRSPYCTVAPASPRPKTLLCSYRITVLRTGFGLNSGRAVLQISTSALLQEQSLCHRKILLQSLI